MPAGDTRDEARRIAREAFLVFEHKEGSRMVDEKYVFDPTQNIVNSCLAVALLNVNLKHLQGYSHHSQVYGDQPNGPANRQVARAGIALCLIRSACLRRPMLITVRFASSAAVGPARRDNSGSSGFL